MVDVAISIAGKVAEMLVVPIWRQICYPFKYKSNMDELKEQVRKLRNQRDVVQHSVDAAKSQGHEIEKLVQDWMKSVKEFDDEVVIPITDGEKKAAGKFCFTLGIRYSLSRKAVKATKDGISLLGDGTFQKVSYRPDIRRTKSVLTRGFEDFDSRMSVFEEIMKALAYEDVNSIGVWGMGGVGKTTLVKRVAAKAIEDGLFGLVVFAEVGQTVNLEKLQKQIADELNMKLDKESVSGKATQIRERLRNEPSILLILDNLWEKLDLDAVGVPVWNDATTSFLEEVELVEKSVSIQRRKLLLTSRDRNVLGDDMNTQMDFFVDTLSDREASNLFWKTTNRAREEADFARIAVEIIKKCAGLPIAITTIATALKNKDLIFWKDALRWLRNSDPKPIKGMEKSVYSTIELSYNILGSEERSLFLLCALLDAGFGLWIQDLIKYTMGLNFFKSIDTMEDARNRMHTILGSLKASCLLLDGFTKDEVKMHDIVHAVAVSIASSKDNLMFYIPNGTRIKEMLEEKLPKNSSMVSHQFGDFIELPEVLEFPNLKLLTLSPNELHSLRIPDTLFNRAKELKVLDLTNFDLLTLPSTLGSLTSLRTLCLYRCLIRDITVIGELKKLKVLSFVKSEVKQLPKEMAQLTCLKMLDLSDCSKLKGIAPNVLSSFNRLEELYMGNSFVHWDVDGQQNASLAELKKLPNLTTLEIQVLRAEIIPSDLFFGKLKSYKIFIGDIWKWSVKPECSKVLKLQLSNGFDLSAGIKSLLKDVEELHLDEPKGVKNVLQTLNEEGFQQLKHLQIQNPLEIQNIDSNSVGWGLCNILPHKLETLVLQNLINMEIICEEQPGAESFCPLKVIKVQNCQKLENLILHIAGHLSQLQKIKVSDCSNLKEIVFVGGKELYHDLPQSTKIEFTELYSLKLEWLPLLSKFGFIDGSNDFKIFFNENVLFPKLEKLMLWYINFQWFKTLAMKKCLFSFPTVKSFKKLQLLKISDYQEVEAIFDIESMKEEVYETAKELIFPNLKTLNFCRLPKLQRFCFDSQWEKKISLSSLVILGIHLIPSTVIWHNPLLKKSVNLRNLKELWISGLDDLKYLFISSEINSLPQLVHLDIRDCQFMETVVVTEENGPSGGCIIFGQLKSLELDGLPNLTLFYSGSCKTEFPCLDKVIMRKCPNMTRFTRGDLSTPNLASVQIENNVVPWEGDLNASIQRTRLASKLAKLVRNMRPPGHLTTAEELGISESSTAQTTITE